MKFVVIEIIPRLGNGRPENGTQTFQSVRPAELQSADNRQRKADKMSAWRTRQNPMFRPRPPLSSISFPRRWIARPLFSFCEFSSPPPDRSLDRRKWRHLPTPDRRPEL